MASTLRDVWGNGVELTEERSTHIQEHPEMRAQEEKIGETLLEPDVVIQSESDGTVRLFHRFYSGLGIGDKHLCVVVKYDESRAFIVTAYFADKIKRGAVQWRR